jgi:hypothetical protein
MSRRTTEREREREREITIDKINRATDEVGLVKISRLSNKKPQNSIKRAK